MYLIHCPPDQPLVSHFIRALFPEAKRRVNVLQKLHCLSVVNCAPAHVRKFSEQHKHKYQELYQKCCSFKNGVQ